MPFTFRVVFGGLCGFVPNTNGHQMRVLVVNATERVAANGESVLPTHVPLFLFDSANRRSQIGRRPLEGDRLLASAEIQEERFRTGRFCGHPLVREEICFRNEEGGSFGRSFETHRSRRSSETTPATGEEDDLFWVPQMEHAFPGAGRIDPECLGEAPPASVAARVRLTEGVVSTASLARDRGRGKGKGKAAPAPALYVFREWVAPVTPSRSKAAQTTPSSSEAVARVHRRANSPVGARPLATGVQLEIEVPGDMVTVWSSRFSHSHEGRWAVSLGPAPGTRIVEAYVYNVSARPLDRAPEVDMDFEFFYDLCATSWELPRPRPVPHPLNGTRAPSPHRPGTSSCSPAIFLPHSEA